MLPQAPRRNRASHASRLGSGTGMSLLLAALLWSGYNTGDWVFRSPHFPSDTLDLIHGVRALFPLLAGWLGILVILSRQAMGLSLFEGPLGLMVIFTIFGTISSLFVSLDPPGALYWGFAFGSVLAVNLAALCSDDPLKSLTWVHYFNCFVSVAIMIGVMASIPYLRGLGGEQIGGSAFDLRQGRFATADILGMAGTRNTGLARYAAVAGLAALARLSQGRTHLYRKLAWLGLLSISVYTLYKTQGRTEIGGFIAGAWVVLWTERRRRAILVPAAMVGAALLYLVGFYSSFWRYMTRGEGFDPTLSGRTVTWSQGWELLQRSPLIGLGFHADRIFLQGQHMSNGLLHALAQSGFLGTIPWVISLLLAWVLVYRMLQGPAPLGSPPLPPDIPGIFAFLTVSSFSESNFVFFSAAWMIGAPLLGYIHCLAWQRRVLHSPAKAARQTRPRFAQPQPAAGNLGKP